MSTIDHITTLLAAAKTPAQTNTLDSNAWENIAVMSLVLGLGPLLHWRLEQLEAAPPPMALAKLAITRQAHQKRNQAIALQLAEILQTCAAQKIPVLVLKGALLAPLAYPEPGLRPMNDIDLLFKPADLPAVDRLLIDLGYQGKFKEADQGPGVTKHLSTYRRAGAEAATPNPYLSAAGERTVEPHGSLEESWFGLKVDVTPGVWNRAKALTLHGQPAYRLSTADTLLHLAVHAVFHLIMGASVFLQLYDLRRALIAWPQDFTWPELIDLTGQAQAQPFVYAAFYWSQMLYQTPIPAPVLQTLRSDCPASLLDYIHALDAPGLLNRTQQPPLTSFGQRLKRGFLDRQETARWAGSLAKKWQVWQTALAIHKTDTAQLLLGRRLKAEA